jgi:ATP-dependent Clp protease protease subunit
LLLLLQGMPIDSSVAELITAQLFVLSQEAPDPIYFYINSTGIAVSDAAATLVAGSTSLQQQ